jgi:hypothetical protein
MPPIPILEDPFLILPYHLRLGLSSVLISLRLFHQSPYAPLLSPIHATCPPHLILLNMITRIIFGAVQIVKLAIM